jgi:hypothetical protein
MIDLCQRSYIDLYGSDTRKANVNSASKRSPNYFSKIRVSKPPLTTVDVFILYMRITIEFARCGARNNR